MAAAAAIAANGINAQSAEARARHAVDVANASGGGIFTALLARLLGTPSPGPGEDAAAAQQSGLNVRQSIASATAINASARTNGRNFASTGAQNESVFQDLHPQFPFLASNSPAPAAASPISHALGEPLTTLVASAGEQTPLTAAGIVQTAETVTTTTTQAQSRLQAAASSGTTPAVFGAATLFRAIPGQVTPAFAAGNPQRDFAHTPQSLGQQSPATPNGALPSAPGVPPGIAELLRLADAQLPPDGSNPFGVPPPLQAATQNGATDRAAAATNGPAIAAAQAATAISSRLGAVALATATESSRQSFVAATHDALHQGAVAPVTEAQALPLHLNPDSANTSAQTPAAATQHQAANASAQPARPQSSTSQAAQASQVSAAVVPLHEASVAQPGAAPAQIDTAALAAAVGQVQAQPAAQSSTFSVQVAPHTAGQSFEPNLEAIAVSVAAQAQSGTKQFNIRLDPPELGRVDVRLTVDSFGRAQAHLAVDKPQTLELLQRDSGSLARALKDSGVQLNNNGLQFSLKGQDRQAQGAPLRARPLAVTAIAATPQAPSGASAFIFSASHSGIDIRV